MEFAAGKLVMRADDGSVTEFELNKDRVTIGRRSDNDICLSNAAVSAEHAVIVPILSDSFLEDLGSTNGTFVNGKPIKRHLLQNDDVIEIGRHRLTFEVDRRRTRRTAASVTETAPIPKSIRENIVERAQALPENDAAGAEAAQSAVLLVLSGSRSGQELALSKDLTSLGKAGMQVVTITRRPHGYLLTHIEGKHPPKVNGRELDSQSYPLYPKDIIELGGVKLQFLVTT
jgi:pSer/pThr/pTyr-binding forkhead associated (FHA) protein